VHIGVLKVRPSREYPDRPDVVEFYDGDGLTTTRFFVFTYDPFDILEFFKSICTAYKSWRGTVTSRREPLLFQCEVKPTGFFASAVQWKVEPTRILIGKPGQTQTPILLQDVLSITPMTLSSRPGLFKFATKQSPEPTEYKAVGLDEMKKLLDAIYTNIFILRLPPENTQTSPHADVPAPSEGVKET
jgi:hypothetical protein